MRIAAIGFAAIAAARSAAELAQLPEPAEHAGFAALGDLADWDRIVVTIDMCDDTAQRALSALDAAGARTRVLVLLSGADVESCGALFDFVPVDFLVDAGEALLAASLLAPSVRGGGFSDGEVFAPLPEAQPAEVTPEAVRRVLRARRRRDAMFPPALFADAAWDVLLETTLARLQGEAVPVTALCFAAAVPQTTGLRAIRDLTQRGMLERTPDPNSRKRILMSITDDAFARTKACIAHTPHVL
jgi:Winged helix DNA-binding domain